MGHNHESAAEIRAKLRKERVKDGMSFSLRWQWELVCSDATPSEKYVGLVLRLFGDADGSNNAPAIRTLAAATGVAKSTVEIALAGSENAEGLAKRGFVDKTEGSGRRPNSYHLKVPVPKRTVDELAEAMDLRSVPTIGTQNGNVPPAGTQASLVVSRPSGHKSRSVPISERSVPTIGYDLDRPRKRKRESARATDHPLPPDWQPSATTIEWAMNGKIGATRPQVDDQLDRFKDYAKANARKLADWDAGFKNWMRKAKDFGNVGPHALNANGTRHSSSGGSPSSYFNYDDGVDRG